MRVIVSTALYPRLIEKKNKIKIISTSVLDVLFILPVVILVEMRFTFRAIQVKD